MAFAARNRVGVAFAPLGALGTTALVPAELTRLKPGSELTLNVVVPPQVRAVATANSLLTLRGVNEGTTLTPLDALDLAATSDGIPEPATSDLAIIGGIVAGATYYAGPPLLSSLGSII